MFSFHRIDRFFKISFPSKKSFHYSLFRKQRNCESRSKMINYVVTLYERIHCKCYFRAYRKVMQFYRSLEG